MPQGSGTRAESVKNQSTGMSGNPLRDCRALTLRAHAMSLRSMTHPDHSNASSTIKNRLEGIHARIEAAAAAAGRQAGSVTLIAVSKTYPAPDIESALQAGQTVFGENRVQEAAAKFPELRVGHPGLRLHLIGALQTNKARDAVRLADVIESLDRPKLLDAIAQAAEREGRTPQVLVQVNVGDEPQKAGVGRVEADQFIGQCQERLGAAVVGLMCVPPAEADPAPHFQWLAQCGLRNGLPVLSMGMSGDFEAAIKHGATHVRIGSAIFGARATVG